MEINLTSIFENTIINNVKPTIQYMGQKQLKVIYLILLTS